MKTTPSVNDFEVLHPPSYSNPSSEENAVMPLRVDASVGEGSVVEHRLDHHLGPLSLGCAMISQAMNANSSQGSCEQEVFISSIKDGGSTSEHALAMAFNMIDVDNNGKNDFLMNFSAIPRKSGPSACFVAHEISHVYKASVSWLSVPSEHPLISTGRWDTGVVRLTQGQTSVSNRITFPNAFDSQPKVVLGFSGLNMGGEWRAHAEASDIDTHGFLLTLHTMRGTHLHGAAITWIAFRADVRNVCAGSFTNTASSRGVVNFRTAFQSPPKVFTAFTKIDAEHKHNLRVRLDIVDVTKTGMEWEISSWLDTVLHECTASYLAIETDDD